MRVVDLTQEHYNKGLPNYEESVHVHLTDISITKIAKENNLEKGI